MKWQKSSKPLIGLKLLHERQKKWISTLKNLHNYFSVQGLQNVSKLKTQGLRKIANFISMKSFLELQNMNARNMPSICRNVAWVGRKKLSLVAEGIGKVSGFCNQNAGFPARMTDSFCKLMAFIFCNRDLQLSCKWVKKNCENWDKDLTCWFSPSGNEFLLGAFISGNKIRYEATAEEFFLE